MDEKKNDENDLLFLFSSDKLEDYLALSLAAILLILILTFR